MSDDLGRAIERGEGVLLVFAAEDLAYCESVAKEFADRGNKTRFVCGDADLARAEILVSVIVVLVALTEAFPRTLAALASVAECAAGAGKPIIWCVPRRADTGSLKGMPGQIHRQSRTHPMAVSFDLPRPIASSLEPEEPDTAGISIAFAPPITKSSP